MPVHRFATVDVSQWTVNALYQRYFAADVTAQLHATAGATLDAWQSNFDVAYGERCHKADFATTVEYQGVTGRPQYAFTLPPPEALIMTADRLALRGTFQVTTESAATAWFIEGLCFATECECNGLPVWTLCSSSRIALNFTVDYAIHLSLVPDAITGLLPLDTVATWANVSFEYENACASASPGAHLPVFARKFNNTFITATYVAYSAVMPAMQRSIEAALHDVASSAVRPAMNKYFPSEVTAAQGLISRYQATSVVTASNASTCADPVDPLAAVSWNISASFSVVDAVGDIQSFTPTDAAALPPLWPTSTMPTAVIATRLTVSSIVVQVLSWYAAKLKALSRHVDNTILDATIAADVRLATPSAALREGMDGALTSIDATLADKDVDAAIRAALTEDRILSRDSAHQLLLTITNGAARMTCRNGSLLLLEANMANVTAWSDVLMQMDTSSSVWTPAAEQAMDPSATPSLFLWIANFDGFRDAHFQIVKPTGGFPRETLISMLEKAMNETLPHVNAAYRRHRFSLPLAAALLLSPLAVPEQALPMSLTRPILQQDSFEATEQAWLSLYTVKPNSSLPPPTPAPPSVGDVHMIVAYSSRPSCGPLAAGTSATFSQQRGVVGTSCRLMPAPAIGMYWRVASFDPTGAEWIEGANGGMFPAPSTLDVLCAADDCTDCAYPNLAFNVSQCLPHNNGTVTLSALRRTSSTVAGQDGVPLCAQLADRTFLDRADLAVGPPSMCDLPTDPTSIRMDISAAPASTSSVATCFVVPGSGGTVVAIGSNGSYGADCLPCPISTSVIDQRCNSVFSLPGETSAAHCVAASDTQLWVARPGTIPTCPVAQLIVPVPMTPPAHGDVGLPVGLSVGAVVLAAIVVVIARRHFKDSVSTYDPEAVAETLKWNAIAKVRVEPLYMTLAVASALACAACALAFAFSPPFKSFTTDHAQALGLPHTLHLDRLQQALDLWTQVVATFFGVVSSVVLAALTASLALRCVAHYSRQDTGWRMPPRVQWVCWAVFRGAPTAVAVGAAAFVFGMQFAVLAPPMRLELQGMANVTLNSSSQTIISGSTVDKYASDVASVASMLEVLPMLLMLVVSFASSIPVAAGVGCALRAVMALSRMEDVPVSRTTLRLLRGAAKDASFTRPDDLATNPSMRQQSSLSPDVARALQFDADLPAREECVAVERLLSQLHPAQGHQHVRDPHATPWPTNTHDLPAAVPEAWTLMQSLTSASIFCMTVIVSFIIFEATRDAAYVSVSFLRAILGLAAIASTHFVARGASAYSSDSLRSIRCLRIGLRIISVALVLDCFFTVMLAAVGALPSQTAAPAMFLHVAALVANTAFFALLDCTSFKSAHGSSAGNFPSLGRFHAWAAAAERFTRPWWRLPCLGIAVVLMIMTLEAHVESVVDNTLRADLIQFMRDNDIQFPKNISSIHLFVDPGIDAYITASRWDLAPMSLSLALGIVSIGCSVLGNCRVCTKRRRRLLVAGRVIAVASYMVGLSAALYFTIPDFLADSQLSDVVPHCAPQFFQEGELLLTTIARSFFSSVVFGRLVPLLVTLPPALVRVQCFVGEAFGVTNHFTPMFVATLVSNIAVQLPLLTIVWAAHSDRVVAIAAALPIALYALVPVFHPAMWSRTRLAKWHLLWLIVALLLWWVVYFSGWISIVIEAILTDPRLWKLARRLFESKALWYEIFANFFLATVAFADTVCLTASRPMLEVDTIADGAESEPSWESTSEEETIDETPDGARPTV